MEIDVDYSEMDELISKLGDMSMSEYWEGVLKNRMPFNDEVNRLSHTLLGHLYTHNLYCENLKRDFDKMDVIEFWSSKRPYGNKDVEVSIAYSLGWDYKRILTISDLPEFMRIEARELHEEVKLELQLILEIS